MKYESDLPNKKERAFIRGVKRATSILNRIGMGMLIVMMLLGTCDVVGRYLFKKPVSGALEISQILLAIMVFFAWGHTQFAKGHVNVEVLFSRFPAGAQRKIVFINTFIGLVFFGIIVWQAANTAKQYWEADRLVHGINIPLAPFQLSVSLGALVLCLVFIVQMIDLILQMKGEN